MIKLPAASWEIWEIGNIEEITGSKPFYYTVKLFVTCGGSDGRKQMGGCCESAKPRSGAQKKNGQVGLEEGLGAHNFIL